VFYHEDEEYKFESIAIF